MASLGEHDTSFHVRLVHEDRPMTQDFVVVVEPTPGPVGMMTSSVLADGRTVSMVTLLPTIVLDGATSELVFVVDRSGSMDGDDKMGQARRALLVQHRLPVRSVLTPRADVPKVAAGGLFLQHCWVWE